MDEEKPLHEHVVERRGRGDWPRARLRDGGGEEAAGCDDEASDQSAQEEETAENSKPVIEGEKAAQ